MFALQQPPSTQPPRQPARSQSQAKRRTQVQKAQVQKQRRYRLMALETTVKLSVNLILISAAVMALAHLIPYRQAQQVKLQELQTAIDVARLRLERDQQAFMNSFDPYRSRDIMQEQTNRLDPNKQPVVLRPANPPQ